MELEIFQMITLGHHEGRLLSMEQGRLLSFFFSYSKMYTYA